MRKILGVLTLFLVACVGFKQGPYSFEEGFNYVKGLDGNYGGDFKMEQLARNFVEVKKIDAFQEALRSFADRVQQDPDSADKKRLLWFIEMRKQMLESERLYQLAGMFGDFILIEERSCDKKKEMEFAYKYYKTSVERGSNATRILDLVLQDSEVAQKLIGVHETGSMVDLRPRFYLSDWDGTLKLVEKLAVSLNECIAQAQQG